MEGLSIIDRSKSRSVCRRRNRHAREVEGQWGQDGRILVGRFSRTSTSRTLRDAGKHHQARSKVYDLSRCGGLAPSPAGVAECPARFQQRSLRLRFQDVRNAVYRRRRMAKPGTHCPGATSCDGRKDRRSSVRPERSFYTDGPSRRNRLGDRRAVASWRWAGSGIERNLNRRLYASLSKVR